LACATLLALPAGTFAQTEGAGDQTSRAVGARPGPASSATWIDVHADYDGDGVIDASGQIHLSDFREAVSRSRARLVSEKRPGLDQPAPRPRPTTVEGSLFDMRSLTLVQHDEPHLIARLRLPDGRTAKVHLGPKSQASELALDHGDTVQIVGRLGRINEMPFLSAERIVKGDQVVDVQYRDTGAVKRVRGTLRDVRWTDMPSDDTQHLVARIRLPSGRTEHIDLGDAPTLRDAEIRDGTTIAALVRPGIVNRQQVLVAEEIVVDEQRIATTRR
jgi:hypothetical protein